MWTIKLNLTKATIILLRHPSVFLSQDINYGLPVLPSGEKTKRISSLLVPPLCIGKHTRRCLSEDESRSWLVAWYRLGGIGCCGLGYTLHHKSLYYNLLGLPTDEINRWPDIFYTSQHPDHYYLPQHFCDEFYEEVQPRDLWRQRSRS